MKRPGIKIVVQNSSLGSPIRDMTRTDYLKPFDNHGGGVFPAVLFWEYDTGKDTGATLTDLLSRVG